MLILVPEVYLPLRMVGTHFHAAAEGLGAARQMIEILEEDPPASGPRTDVPDLATATISFSDVGVGYVGREDSAVEGLSFAIAPGSVTALVGPSGCGKSTALAVLERFIDVDAGSVWVESNGSQVELREYAIDAWRRAVAWVGQDPTMVSGSLADNVRLANSSASDSDVLRALEVVIDPSGSRAARWNCHGAWRRRACAECGASSSGGARSGFLSASRTRSAG